MILIIVLCWQQAVSSSGYAGSREHDRARGSLDPLVAAIVQSPDMVDGPGYAITNDPQDGHVTQQWVQSKSRRRPGLVERPDRPCTNCGTSVSCTWRPGPFGSGTLCNSVWFEILTCDFFANFCTWSVSRTLIRYGHFHHISFCLSPLLCVVTTWFFYI